MRQVDAKGDASDEALSEPGNSLWQFLLLRKAATEGLCFEPSDTFLHDGPINVAPRRGSQGTIEHPVELETIIGDEQQINTCIERFNDRSTHAILKDGAHDEIVGHDDSFIAPRVADKIGDDASGV